MTDVAAHAPRHLGALDGVRAVAAYTVIATHVGFNSGRSLDNGPFAPLLARLDFGVTLFFLLSGFLLFRPFAAAAVRGTPGPRIGPFWWRRFLRIAPAYWLALSVTLALISTRRASGTEWRSYLLLTQTYTGHDVDTYLTQMWTLAVEISFYACLPLASVVTRRIFRRAELTGQLCLVGFFAAAALAANLAMHAGWGDAAIGLLWLPAYLDWFGLGMLLAIASCLPVDGPRWRRTLGDWASAPGTCWAIGVGLFWIATLPVAGPRNLLPGTPWQWTTKHLLYGGTAFFFLLPVVLGSSGWISRTLGSRVARWLGEISYGVYLWHLGLLLLIQRWIGWHSFTGHFWSLYVLTAVSATAVAATSWRLVERPLLRRFSRPWRRSTEEQAGERQQAEQLDTVAVTQDVS
jgi:peptidoglycan/LPS O-acetylase OafA/YrhL